LLLLAIPLAGAVLVAVLGQERAGAVRWVSPDVGDSTSTAFLDNGFEIGSQDSTVLTRVEVDGRVGRVTLVAILSQICSSAYEADDGQSLLINYAVADNRTHARVIGLDASRNPVFDFEYPTTSCDTSWNAIPLPLQHMEFR